MLYVLLAGLLIGADQLVKYLVRAHIPLGESVPFLPHIMNLTYCQNTGAAFSLLSRHTWLLTLVSLAASAVLIFLVVKVFRHPAARLMLTVVLAGAVGNLIDRVRFRFVTDMFQTIFIRFAVFNVADICVVLGGIAFCVYYFFFHDKVTGKESGHDASASDR
ncbi:signal peptidase II [Pseudoflavonifractor sp. 524-17]|uniref:signal peptidase II n=1 Tax=Pseudoflavonifractor sp. 524-17 TaxID=2304577 RepID=UPI00137A406E|nr:signal peptidase II [Pseudoflavonifractor sp. 524-17]NCE64699.1 signal peptidase II [Pseudoflavonifractor sp. 524-17]